MTPETKRPFCFKGHARIPDNLTENGSCGVCARARALQWKREQPFPCGHERTIENTNFRVDGRAFGCGVCPPKKRPPRKDRKVFGKEKTCVLCGQEKDVSEFVAYGRKDGSTFPGSRCRECHNLKCLEHWHSLSWDQRRAKHHKSKLKKFGLSEEDFNLLEKRANGVCELCGNPERVIAYENGNLKGFAIDHDHATGVVRGLLCHNCNLKMGWVDKVGFERVQKYLELNK
jgi:hypothetical protein